MNKRVIVLLLTALILAFLILIRQAPLAGNSSSPSPTSPPLSRATVQEVQRQVNEVLLRATVIRATYQVVRFGDGVEPATATAFDQDYQANIATIEALRPTADAAHIMLLQQAITPTLESEATLFAAAYTASAPFTVNIPAGYEAEQPTHTPGFSSPPTTTPAPPDGYPLPGDPTAYP